MRQFNISKGVKGFYTLYKYGLRFKHMISLNAQSKARILSFWEKHGLSATKDAHGVGRSTLFVWKKKLKEGQGNLESLNDASRAPMKRRLREINPRIIKEILRLRSTNDAYRLSKDKIHPLLNEFCIEKSIPCPSVTTIGRILTDLKKAGRLPAPVKLSFYGKTGTFKVQKVTKRKKNRRPRGHKTTSPGEVVQIDTVVIFINGLKRYIITAVDVYARFAFAYGYTTLNSKNAAHFYSLLEGVAPFTIKAVQTDNGLEFEKYFRALLEAKNITHYHNYPKCPKMNAYVERFNRTIQEEFTNHHGRTLAYDLLTFNMELMGWLIWYNTKRPHKAHGQKPPMEAIVGCPTLFVTPQESRMGWTHTCT